MNIVTVAYLQGFGGAERQIIMLSNALAEKGHSVHLLVLAKDDCSYEISEKVTIHNLAKKENPNNRILNRFLLLKKELSEIKPDITINFIFQSSFFCSILPKRITGKVVYAERSDPYDSGYSLVLKLQRRFAISRMEGFVFQSEGARDFFNDKVKRKSIVIHNPLIIKNIDDYRSVEKKNIIVNVGRLHPQKNQELLIKAFAKIAFKHNDWILKIYGDGDLKEHLQNLIYKLGIEKQVSIYPSTKDIFSKIAQASIFALSSDYEGMPNVLMEAMAIGLPCISTDCRPGGARALIQNGVNGIIVPIMNVNALSNKIEWMIEHPDESNYMAQQAVKIVENHSPEHIYMRWESFLNNL